MIHEWAHALTSSTASHDVSFRRLYSLGVFLWTECYPAKPLSCAPWTAVVDVIERYTEQWHTGYESRFEYRERTGRERKRILLAGEKMLDHFRSKPLELAG
jgi:hypothetical protein